MRCHFSTHGGSGELGQNEYNHKGIQWLFTVNFIIAILVYFATYSPDKSSNTKIVKLKFNLVLVWLLWYFYNSTGLSYELNYLLPPVES